MTSKRIAPPAAQPAGQFPEFPPRDDMQNALHLNDQGHQPALRRHLGAPQSTVVIGEVPIGWNIHTRREVIRVPDLLIAFDVDRDLVVAEMGYSIDEHGKPPDFALEIASPNTARNDETRKRIDYARFGVTEYWRFDSQGGPVVPAGFGRRPCGQWRLPANTHRASGRGTLLGAQRRAEPGCVLGARRTALVRPGCAALLAYLRRNG